MGAERFLVQAPIHDAFVSRAAAIARKLRQGATADEQGGRVMDVGATCLPGLAQKIASLVDDAVAKGAKVSLFILNSVWPMWIHCTGICFEVNECYCS